jgi:hypothetical protein
MEMISDAVVNNRRKSSIDWQWREYETLKLYSTFLCYKNVCFEIMDWKYEFSLIFNTLILTLNDDILVILNDVILTSTILVNLVITLVHHVSSRRRAIPQYMLVSLCIRAHQNAQETLMKFWFTSANFSFFNRFVWLYGNTK